MKIQVRGKHQQLGPGEPDNGPGYSCRLDTLAKCLSEQLDMVNSFSSGIVSIEQQARIIDVDCRRHRGVQLCYLTQPYRCLAEHARSWA